MFEMKISTIYRPRTKNIYFWRYIAFFDLFKYCYVIYCNLNIQYFNMINDYYYYHIKLH